jgi:hypothetical protein
MGATAKSSSKYSRPLLELDKRERGAFQVVMCEKAWGGLVTCDRFSESSTDTTRSR